MGAVLAKGKGRTRSRPRVASSARQSADGVVATAIARTEFKIRSQSDDAVTHSELETGLQRAVHVDTHAEAA